MKYIVVRLFPNMEIYRCYIKHFKELPNLKRPTNLIEKIFWLEWNSDTTLWSKCADKYMMRKYVDECGYSNYLPKLYGVWAKGSDIDFSILPNEFILKSNNGCGQCYIVENKYVENVAKINKMTKQWLMINQAFANAQFHYNNIKPMIIAEELLHHSAEDLLYSPNSLVDYKVWCFNGEPESILVVYDRKSHNIKINLYDLNWVSMPEKIVSSKHYIYDSRVIIPKPICLHEMLEIASNLSKPFLQSRIDFYVIGGRPIIGEITLSSGYGYFTKDYYKYLGNKIDLSRIKSIHKHI